MAEKTLNARVLMKYDTLANWNQSTVILKAGEIAVATIDSPTGGEFDANKAPVIGIKVGDGTHKFSALNWIQSIAGDVYAWAKAATKPTYTADEIDGLSDYISGEIDDSDTQYKIEQDTTDKHKLTLYSKALGGNWTAASTITIPDNNTTYTLAEGTKNGQIKVTPSEGDAYEVKVHGLGSAAFTDSGAYAAKGYETKVDTLVGSDTGKSARTIANEELTAKLIPANAKESLDTLQEIAAWIQAHPDDASKMSSNIAALRSALSYFVTDTNGTYSATQNSIKDYVDTSITNADVSGKIKTEIDKLSSNIQVDNQEEDGSFYYLAAVTQTNGLLSGKLQGKLAKLSRTGNVNDLIQTSGDILILDCGSSSVNV